MKLPRSLQPTLEALEPIVAGWPADVSIDQLVKWIIQFDPDDHDLALRILQHLNVLGSEDIRSGLRVSYARLQRRAKDRDTEISNRNTMFFAVGDAGKSGAMIAYEFRLANELPESNFSTEQSALYLEQRLVKNVVLVDDVIGTGQSAIRAAKTIKEEATPLGVENVFVLSVCGFQEALEAVSEQTGADTFSAFTYDKRDTVISFDSPFYSGLPHEKKEVLLERLKYYNSRCSRSELGYGGIGALMAFTHNPPNVSLPVIWASGNGWNPLFPRLSRMSGMDHFFAQAKAAQEKLVEDKQSKNPIDSPVTEKEERQVTVLVEGKTDELVMDIIVSQFGFAEALQVDRVSVVSLGGMYGSTRLFDIIKETGGDYILLLDRDRMTEAWISQYGDQIGIPIVKLNPSVIGLFRLQQLRDFVGLEPDTQTADTDRIDFDSALYKDTEHRLRLRGFGRSHNRTMQVIDMFVNPKAVEDLLRECCCVMDRLREGKRRPHLDASAVET